MAGYEAMNANSGGDEPQFKQAKLSEMTKKKRSSHPRCDTCFTQHQACIPSIPDDLTSACERCVRTKRTCKFDGPRPSRKRPQALASSPRGAKSPTDGADRSPATQSSVNRVEPPLGKKSSANGGNHSLATQSHANGADHTVPTQSRASRVDISPAIQPCANGVSLHGNGTFQPTFQATQGPRNMVYPPMTYINSSGVQVIRTLESQLLTVSYRTAQFPRTTLPSIPHQFVQTLPSQLRQVTNCEDLTALPHVDNTTNSNYYSNQASQMSEAEQRETIRSLSIMLGARQQQEQQGVRYERG